MAAVHNSANAALIAGYGYAGILVAFMARHSPLAVIPVAILFGGFGAAILVGTATDFELPEYLEGISFAANPNALLFPV